MPFVKLVCANRSGAGGLLIVLASLLALLPIPASAIPEDEFYRTVHAKYVALGKCLQLFDVSYDTTVTWDAATVRSLMAAGQSRPLEGRSETRLAASSADFHFQDCWWNKGTSQRPYRQDSFCANGERLDWSDVGGGKYALIKRSVSGFQLVEAIKVSFFFKNLGVFPACLPADLDERDLFDLRTLTSPEYPLRKPLSYETATDGHASNPLVRIDFSSFQSEYVFDASTFNLLERRYLRPSQSGPVLIERARFEDYREVSSGLTVPFRITVEGFREGASRTAKVHTTPVHKMLFAVRTFSVDEAIDVSFLTTPTTGAEDMEYIDEAGVRSRAANRPAQQSK